MTLSVCVYKGKHLYQYKCFVYDKNILGKEQAAKSNNLTARQTDAAMCRYIYIYEICMSVCVLVVLILVFAAANILLQYTLAKVNASLSFNIKGYNSVCMFYICGA